ncbi:MAG: SAM-dependent methyltransferase [Sulfurovum sp.]|nr:SAM-dependent methyltransferase [Sulfurovum sp.]
MKLKNIVPWGRNLKEYRAMFLLDSDDLQKKILGCGDGPASFNAEVTKMGGEVVSIDPAYAFTKDEIAAKIEEIAPEVMARVREHQDIFVWKNIKDPDDLYAIRMGAMGNFLDDYEEGLKEGRYRHELLPNLSFSEKEFELVLSSHLLFLYNEHLDFEFHLKAVEEMLRVGKEVRIFPLVTLENKYSPHLKPLCEALEKQGFKTEIVKSEYEFQKGGDEMLRVGR